MIRYLLIVIAVAAMVACKNGLDVSVEFENQSGLSDGDSVYFSNIEVGEVDSISPHPEAKGVRVVLDLDPEKVKSLKQGSVAMIVDRNGSKVVELFNFRSGKEPITSGSKLQGMNSLLEYTAWQAGEAIDFTQITIDSVASAVNSYFGSDEWMQQKQKIETGIQALEESTQAALNGIGKDVDKLVGELESKSKDAEKHYNELSAVLRAELEGLLKQGEESLAKSMQRILEALEQSMKRHKEQREQT